ncbi:MAG: hypothetical protein IT350_08635 [Deltaproteobacteria bacterium]|nr:hypothetical protein [Deltaproteobacteria bacterium]
MKRKAVEVKAGDIFCATSGVGRYQPIYYAGASGDFNPIHIDAEFGKMVGLGGAILQGLCTMAFTARAHTDWAGDPTALRRLKVRFAKPVYPEDDITTAATIASVEGNTVTTQFVSKNQNGVEVITRAVAEFELD